MRCGVKLPVGSCTATTTSHGTTILFVLLFTPAFTKHVNGSRIMVTKNIMPSSIRTTRGAVLPSIDAFVTCASPQTRGKNGGSKLRRRVTPELLSTPLMTQQSMKNDRNSPDASSSFAEITNTVSMTSSRVGNDNDTANENPVDDVSSTTTTVMTPSQSSTNEYSFFDEATIYVRAGSGGQASSTYKKVGKNQNGPPTAATADGGDVVLRIDEGLNTLAGLSRYAHRPNAHGGGGAVASANGRRGAAGWVLSFRAENGRDGERQNRRGRDGRDVVVRVPPGTIVQEVSIEEEVRDATTVRPAIRYVDCGTITRDDPTLVIATGGKGGDGSGGGPADKSQPRGIRPPRMPPRPGERKRLRLTLKVIADVALVAVPNAGKSTLLGKVTRAKPKIADYPFTTVVPNLGVWVPPFNYSDEDDTDDDQMKDSNDSKSLLICDVPGLIAGASEGIGLGHAFLRHVERCHVILHLLDATSASILEEYAMINRELLNYGTGKLATMPQVVVVNKVDAAFGNDDALDNDGSFRCREDLEGELLKIMPHTRLMWISAKEGDGVDDLMERVAMFVNKVKATLAVEEEKRKTGHLDEDAPR